MLCKTDLKLTGNERLSIFSKFHAFSFYSPRLFVLSFVLCLFLSFSFASADNVDSYSSIEDFIITQFSGIDFTDIDYIFDDSVTFLSVSELNNNIYKSAFLFPSDNVYTNAGGNSSFAFNFYGGSFDYVGFHDDSLSNRFIYEIYLHSSGNYYIWRYLINNPVYVSQGFYRYEISNKTIVKSSTNAAYGWAYYYFNDSNTHFYSNTENIHSPYMYVNSSGQFYYTDYSQYLLDVLNLIVVNPYSSDERLKLYTTQSASRGSLLHIDLSEFYQYNNGVSSSYSFSDVVLTLDCDGTEHSFTLTPSASQYEFLDTSTSSTRVYGYIVPYSFFSVSEYQNCSVVKVDFTRTISSPGGSGTENFKISCSYPLKVTNINGNSQDFASVTLAPVPSVTVEPDQSTVQDWSNNISYHSPSFGHNGSYVLLNDLPIFPNWVDKYTLDCTIVNKTVDGITLNLWIDLDNPYVSVNTAFVDIPITAFFTPESYLKDNVLTDFYDVVVFKVWSDTAKTSVDGYLYFYTEKYDLKYQNNLVVQELSLEYDSLNLLSSGFSLIRTGLDNIDNNTSAFFTDSLFNDTIVISWLKTLNNTNAFGFADVINAIEDIPQYDDTSVLSGIASIVSAIEGVDSPDLSDLESKLDTLINFFVADGSTENASSRTYRNWLRGVDDNTQRTVTYYAGNVFSIVHDVFDLFDADGSVYYPPDSEDVVSTDYINFVKLFIEKMNSSTITNTEYNKYLRGFFQGGFDPHLIDGGL